MRRRHPSVGKISGQESNRIYVDGPIESETHLLDTCLLPKLQLRFRALDGGLLPLQKSKLSLGCLQGQVKGVQGIWFTGRVTGRSLLQIVSTDNYIETVWPQP